MRSRQYAKCAGSERDAAIQERIDIITIRTIVMELQFQYVLDALRDFSSEVSDIDISLAFVGASLECFKDIHDLREYGYEKAFRLASDIKADIGRGVFFGDVTLLRACKIEDEVGSERSELWFKGCDVDLSRLDQYEKLTFREVYPVVQYVVKCIELRSKCWVQDLFDISSQGIFVDAGQPTYGDLALELGLLRVKCSELEAKLASSVVTDTSKLDKLKRGGLSSFKKKVASRNKARQLALWLMLIYRDGPQKIKDGGWKNFVATPEFKALEQEFDGDYSQTTLAKDFSYWVSGNDDGFNLVTMVLLEEMLVGVPTAPKLPRSFYKAFGEQDFHACISSELSKLGRSLPGNVSGKV